MGIETRKDKAKDQLEDDIAALLDDAAYDDHPLRAALQELWETHRDYLLQLERLTAISDGYQSAIRERNQSMKQRYQKQLRQLNKIVRISDRYGEMQRELNDALRIASTHDPLTDLPNRRLILDRLKAETASVERGRATFALALLDIDRFKRINDQSGHDAGDAALIGVARALSGSLRAYDLCARWGGEEFMLLLPETPLAAALLISERLRATIAALQPAQLSGEHRVTVSIGLTVFAPGESWDETIKRADVALYEAKNQGRNRVVQKI